MTRQQQQQPYQAIDRSARCMDHVRAPAPGHHGVPGHYAPCRSSRGQLGELDALPPSLEICRERSRALVVDHHVYSIAVRIVVNQSVGRASATTSSIVYYLVDQLMR